MYQATTKERVYMKDQFGYSSDTMDVLEIASDEVRKGEPIDISLASSVIAFQELLKAARKATKPWWKFW